MLGLAFLSVLAGSLPVVTAVAGLKSGRVVKGLDARIYGLCFIVLSLCLGRYALRRLLLGRRAERGEAVSRSSPE